MSAEIHSTSSGPPVRLLLKAYWRYWRGELREAQTLAEAMIARDNSDKVAQRLLTKIAAKQANTGTFAQWEPSPNSEKFMYGIFTLISLFATAKLLSLGFQRRFTYLIYWQSRSGESYYSLWFLLLISLLWNAASIWHFVKMVSNRK